ncbi:hypothetical protein [Paracoccus marinus]|uniref:hypothetical protein n=1 Tax=Paracoccus marinus TaxID=288426 RepID=UPI00163DA851|nr:hypothetical protein [Paracoccus marinus]
MADLANVLTRGLRYRKGFVLERSRRRVRWAMRQQVGTGRMMIDKLDPTPARGAGA